VSHPPALSDEECQAIAEACACHPNGWVPHDENLPLAERLRERGILARSLRNNGTVVVYHVSAQFVAASAQNAAMGSAWLSMN
jgi:hypothetical protein